MGFLRCLIFMVVIGILCFPFGRMLALIEFDASHGLFSPLPFEKDGLVYNRLNIRKWQNKVPDMSRIFPGIIPKKTFEKCCNSTQVKLLIQETCVAELTHWVLCVAGIAIPFIWNGIGGVILFILYVLLGNLPFIVIQRYNRPRLCHMQKVLEKREKHFSHNNENRKDPLASCVVSLAGEAE